MQSDIFNTFNFWEFEGQLEYGEPISEDDETLVQFIGFDQRKDTDRNVFHFTNLKLNAFDIVHVYLEFSKIVSGTRLSTSQSSGHYHIVISSNKLSPLQQEKGYELPNHLEESDGELFRDFELKLLALEEDVVFNISLNLLHGSHLENLHYFNETVRMDIMRPNRAHWGEHAASWLPKTFLAILNRELLSAKGYELPLVRIDLKLYRMNNVNLAMNIYNMPPGLADTPGDPSMVVDMANEKDITEDRTIASTQMPGVIWDLLENPDKPVEAGNCKIPNKEDVKPVPPLFIDLSTLEVTMEANSDECSLIIPCRYEDPMVNHLNTPWMSIEEETKLYYLTRDPRSFEDFARGGDLFDSLVGTDNLVGVTLASAEREGMYPRSVAFSIAYMQEGTELKKIVEAGIELSDFDDDYRRLDYNLTIEYKPMVWSELMNAFQLPLSVYCVLFALIGAAAVVVTWLSWLVMRIGVKRVQVLSMIIKLAFTDFADPFQGIGCSWPQAVGTSGAAEGMDAETCRQARMECFRYSDFFGTYTVNFIVGFTFMMMAVEAVFARAVRETLLLIPLLAACEVVLFIATMGADNFQDFAESFFVELLLKIADRLVFGSVFQWIDYYATTAMEWLRTRSFLWSTFLAIGGPIRNQTNVDKIDDIGREVPGLKFSSRARRISGAQPTTSDQVVSLDENEDDGQEHPSSIEEAIEEHVRGGSTAMSKIGMKHVL
ncbi:hypothetical protein Pmar_PMAR014510 [Perkinsus marinus ATCC 50983]|uniref:Uncharacterized protein n=1 Tax=Perkinsus marinus (strain ATCC 50983 / TXsc) TaxID=423536 RepID=C5KWA0_PERM5|nr:hypothetical protein Pmar_PMAR014510 [Perkinsus marinus ATCC 50983]EER11211.1 hypothetical protein Pmar_PMAR014510 [Perkinsus marinus ATCC 50983]|eukprot:XP_002779416.1 hypothetical protein Pmar_PMAR014510 [Perkinsus marinus ATCC 50983]